MMLAAAPRATPGSLATIIASPNIVIASIAFMSNGSAANRTRDLRDHGQ